MGVVNTLWVDKELFMYNTEVSAHTDSREYCYYPHSLGSKKKLAMDLNRKNLFKKKWKIVRTVKRCTSNTHSFVCVGHTKL